MGEVWFLSTNSIGIGIAMASLEKGWVGGGFICAGMDDWRVLLTHLGEAKIAVKKSRMEASLDGLGGG